MKINKNTGITLIALSNYNNCFIDIGRNNNTGNYAYWNFCRMLNEQNWKIKERQISEYLKLKLINEQTNNPFGSAEEIIRATRNNVIENIDDLKKMGKDVTIGETSTEEDGERCGRVFLCN